MAQHSFEELVGICTNGRAKPYDYQHRLAAEGFPDVLAVPTGAGKTMAVVLGWLYRRRFHPDPQVRQATPHWLVICQPMRTLVEQVRNDVDRWLAAAGLSEGPDAIGRFVFMGGEPTAENDWRQVAHRDAIAIGTQDMLLSRALNRGFGSSRYLWPVEFGVLNSGCQWVFDEVQLMGAAVPTSRQLEAFRCTYPSLLPHGSTWMSATVDHSALATVDNPTVGTVVELSDGDRSGPLGRRLQAPKRLLELTLPTDNKRHAALAAAAIAGHRAGTITLVIVNTVADAQATHDALRKAKPAADLLLIHSRYRRSDRAALVDRLVQPVDPNSAGLICVSTQVIEAGMDLNAASMITEAAPWSSVVQRLGRCNRTGTVDGATVQWFASAKPDKPRPYDADDVASATTMLRSLEGQTVIADGLAALGPVPRKKLHPVLRRRDLGNLFDTSPEIGGADIDITPYVRDLDDDRTVHIAWRHPVGAPSDWVRPNQSELCPAPLGKDLEAWVQKNPVWRYDLGSASWVELAARDLRPNQLLLADSGKGGYTLERGWDPTSTTEVPPVTDRDTNVVEIAERNEDTEEDSASEDQHIWVTLSRHLLDAEEQAATVSTGFGLDDRLTEVVTTAARLHDIGKAHEVFQTTMAKGAGSWPDFSTHAPIAKSTGRHRHSRPCFRHELASALALLSEGAPALSHLTEADRFLCVYLVAAHHGRIRMGLRTMPRDEAGAVLGIHDGEMLPPVRIGEFTTQRVVLNPSHFTGIGMTQDGPMPWFERSADLLVAHGPFALGLLEATVRFADWLASASPTDEGFPRG